MQRWRVRLATPISLPKPFKCKMVLITVLSSYDKTSYPPQRSKGTKLRSISIQTITGLIIKVTTLLMTERLYKITQQSRKCKKSKKLRCWPDLSPMITQQQELKLRTNPYGMILTMLG